MKTKQIVFGLLVLSLLSCNYVSQMLVPPTATPIPTFTPTITASPTLIPTATPLAPVYIPPECEAQPHPTLSPDFEIQPQVEFENENISKRTQLRILDDIEELVEDVYVYPDYNGKDWNGIVASYRNLVDTGITTDQFYFEMQNMIDELEDDHSAFISPAGVRQTNEELSGEFEYVGVGVYSEVDFERERLVVISIFPGSPAEYSGIQPHDSILLVDGLPITLDSGVRTLGPPCTAVTVTVQSPGGSPRDVMLIRTSINESVPIDAHSVPTTDGSNIGYIFIPSFFDETLPPQIESALQEFGQLDGLILDLRQNGGGSSTVAYPILSFFADGRLGEFVSRAEIDPLIIEANPIQNSQTVPLVIMVSEDTVSFGELFSGVLRDARGAKIVGETSLGNVEVLNGYNFEDGSVIWIAAETFYSDFSDDDWEETGIVPDLEAHAEWDTFNFDTDPAISASLELLGHK
ncbi:MAG TPA: S41 family peptidase [Anaerolineales bacterium]|nr:S41 family peptidase [Anaerolineales bacterium]